MTSCQRSRPRGTFWKRNSKLWSNAMDIVRYAFRFLNRLNCSSAQSVKRLISSKKRCTASTIATETISASDQRAQQVASVPRINMVCCITSSSGSGIRARCSGMSGRKKEDIDSSISSAWKHSVCLVRTSMLNSFRSRPRSGTSCALPSSSAWK